MQVAGPCRATTYVTHIVMINSKDWCVVYEQHRRTRRYLYTIRAKANLRHKLVANGWQKGGLQGGTKAIEGVSSNLLVISTAAVDEARWASGSLLR